LETIPYSKPTVKEEKPLELAKEELAYAPKLLEASENGFIRMDLEKDVIIQRVSHDLYASPNSGFRELYQNEARACREAKRIGAEPRIEVTLSPLSRKLVIHGIDSMGISQEKFLHLYRFLGRTDNWNGSEVGQWGLGKAAYCTMSDTMLLETYSREDKTRYAVVGRNAMGYSLAPEPKNLSSYGTRITLILREDVEIASLYNYIVECSRFSGVETFLNLQESLTDRYRDGILKSAGRYRLGPESIAEYLKKKTINSLAGYYNDKLAKYVPVVIRGEGFELHGCFAVSIDYEGKRSVMRRGRAAEEVYLIGVPISADEVKLPFSGWVLNLLDERMYQPTADRERLQDESVKRLMQELKPAITEAISFLNLESIDEYLESGLHEVYEGYDQLELEDYLSEKTLDICKLLKTHVKELGHWRQVALYTLLKEAGKGGCEKIFCVSPRDYRRASILSSNIPDAKVFALREPNVDSMERLRRYGIRFGDEYIRENGLRDKRYTENMQGEEGGRENGNGHFQVLLPVHSAAIGRYSWGRFQAVRRHVSRIREDELDERTIIIPSGKALPYLSLLSQLKTSYRLVVGKKLRNEPSKCILLSDFAHVIGEKSVLTNLGFKLAREICYSNLPAILHIYSDPSLALEFSDYEREIHIFGDDDLLFELSIYFTYNNHPYRIDRSEDDMLEENYPDLSYRSFLDYPDFGKIGDSEIIFSVIHVMKKVKDEGLRKVFLNAARYSRDADEVKSMRETVLKFSMLSEKAE
jgi:hypothetical protein